MAVKWENCAFFQKEIEWLGFTISNSGLKPLVGISDSIKSLPNPKNISELRPFFGSINQFMKFVPNLSILKSPFRPLSVRTISLPMERRSYEGFRKTKETDRQHYREQSF